MYSAEDISWMDIDWFAVDARDRVAHFTTGGGIWPPAPPRNDRAGNERALAAVLSLSPTSTFAFFEDVKALKHAVDPAKYRASFEEIAARGLYAFDIDEVETSRAIYVCVAAPKKFLSLDNLRQIEPNCIVAKMPFDFGLGCLVAVDHNGVDFLRL